jgi:hypothetical protein
MSDQPKRKRGAQPGNRNSADGKLARRALTIAIGKMHDGTEDTRVIERIQPLVDIWYRAIDEAKNGNIQATNTIMDRLDGKPTNSVDIVADIQNRTVEDLSDEELLSIAQHGSRGAAEKASGEEEPPSFY